MLSMSAARLSIPVFSVVTAAAIAACAPAFDGNIQRIPPRVASNLDAIAGDYAAAYATAKPDEPMLFAYNLQKDWHIARHPMTGIIMRRDATVMFGYRYADGTCGVQRLIVEQESLPADKWGPLSVRNLRKDDGSPFYEWHKISCADAVAAQNRLRREGCPACVPANGAAQLTSAPSN